MSITTIDLFAGAGGITKGFADAGANCLFANDFKADAVNTFKLNLPATEVHQGPVEELNPSKIRKSLMIGKGELDALVGGPPLSGILHQCARTFFGRPQKQSFSALHQIYR